MAEDTSLTVALCFRVFLCFFLAPLCAASCEKDAVGLADGYILDSQLTASSELNANSPAKNGRLNYTAGSSWCASTGDRNPYLQIDLQTLHIICAVSTQGNSQGDQWVETYTLQSSTDGTTWTDYKEHGQSNKKSFNGNYDKDSTVKHILYSGIVGRYLRFVSGAKHGGVCLRVEVFGVPRSKGNIAFLKPTTQSGTLFYQNRYNLKSSYAVDGGKSTSSLLCAHTDDSTNSNPWWRVDLGRVEPVAEVYILNNGDLDKAEIRVGNSTTIGVANSHLCTTAVAVPSGTSKTFFCRQIAYGRYVSISLLGVTNKYLKLCEVEVYSSYISNLALKQPASQISTDHGGAASRAVDGNPNNKWRGGSCTHTDLATDPWWRVDLGSSFPVAKVVIVNRLCTDVCADVLKAFEIRIGNSNLTGDQSNPSCGGTHSMVTGETKSFYCTPRLLGRFVYVLVRTPPNIQQVLTICELEVYSTKQSTNDVKGCASDPVGVSNSASIRDQRFSASSSLSSSSPSNGRLKGVSAWIPGTNSDNNDYLQIDLGSVYFVCGVAVQGNPAADNWTTTYKIKTSLNNVNWKIYSEDGTGKTFTGNNDRNSIIRSELYEPLAAKFIRFYPVSFNTSKALRVEVYGSMQGCFSSVGNERNVNGHFGIFASSVLDNSHIASYSRLYGGRSWCSSSGPLPHYLEFDFRSVITVTGLATQGDAANDKWVKSYTFSYGYDKQRWIRYAAGQQLSGNSDRSTVVVKWFSKPFAAQYVRIFPTSNNGICMRMDLFVCKDFQLPYIFVKLEDVELTANPSASVTLNCTATFSPPRPPVYEWGKNSKVLPGSASFRTITYQSATDTHNNYHCARIGPSVREVQCSSTYQCTASLPGMEAKDVAKANVSVVLKVPGPPAVQVDPGNIKARSTSVTWSAYYPGSDELPIDEYTLQYQNGSFNDNITLSGGLSRKDLINLKPYTSYSVRMMAKSALGEGLWSGLVNFQTKTAAPEVIIQDFKVTNISSQSISVGWKKPDFSKLNGPRKGYKISYKEAGKAAKTVIPPASSTSWILSSLKKYTKYFIKIAVTNRDHTGPWSNEREAETLQDAPSKPLNLQLQVQGPSGKARPRMTVTWEKPTNENGVITKYTLVYTYIFKGKVTTARDITNSGILKYSFDVLGGIQYTVNIWAETIKPGPNITNNKLVPVYAPSIAPPNMTLEKRNETTYRISWDPLPREMSNGDVIIYEVNQTMVSSSRTARAISSVKIVLVNTSDTFKDLSGLEACSQYDVQVRAYTTAGPGLFGIPERIKTTAPGPPSDVRTEKAEERSITLSWSKPKRHGDAVKQYMVIFVGTKYYDSKFKHAGTRATTSMRLTVGELYPGTLYSFVVIAETDCGEGENSTKASRQTKIGAPVAPVPRDLQEIETIETSVNVTVWPALQTNGPISHYQLLVHHVKQWTDDVSDWEVYGENFYISAQIPAASVKPSMVFVIGDEKTYDGHVNKKLLGGQKYKIYSRALTSKTKKKRSTDQQFLFGEARLIARVDVDEVVIASESPTSAKNQGSPTAAIAASVVVVLVVVLVVLVAGVIFWRRRRQLGDRDSKSESHAMTAVNGAFDTAVNEAEIVQENPPAEEAAAAAAAAVARVPDTGDPIYGNTEPAETDDKPKPVPVNRFSEYVTRLKREKNAGFGKQYKMLVPGQQFSWDVAKKPENKNKNRYGNIIAYDHSRVPLPFIDGVEHSDYMNASYLHGYDGTPKTYIASQGPVPGTYQDFWRMIWQENATTIVMLTRLVEHGRTKCHQYWPEKSETYHEITVTNHKTEKFADYAVRTFVLCENESGERRQVQQFHFLVWPDKGVPRHATAVLGLRRKVRAKHRDSAGPLVVHCSAGVGRTGAFVVIDAMLESARNKKVVDVFNYVQMIRANRISMVQTEEQYGFIYMALLEAVTCGNTEIPAHDIRIAVKKLATVNPKTKLSALALEYQRLELITADDVADREDDVGLKPKNASKNRFPDIVPLNGSRVVLKGDENNDYINASFVDTYRERNSFILTQAPLSNTIEDFWRMVWDYSVGTVVMLNEQKEKGQVYPIYWPSEGSVNFGEFVIETTSHEIFQDFSERELTVAKKKDPKVVRRVHHYQVAGWADKDIPANPQCILDLINMVDRSQRNSNNAPVIVQCSNGVGRSGTFCAILSIIERLKTEQVIDVCQSVKVIRVNRPKAVDSKKQYIFCYNLVQKYLDSFSDYANFN